MKANNSNSSVIMPEMPQYDAIRAINKFISDLFISLREQWVDEVSLNLYDELRSSLQPDVATIVFSCNTENIQGLRPDLQKEEATQVLRIIQHDINMKFGRLRDAIKDYADELYP